jgi:hypothetical protein
LSKVLEAKIAEEFGGPGSVGAGGGGAAQAGAPPTVPLRPRATSLGDMSNMSTRRLLIDLISTLNASFPDYDFSVVSPDSFASQDLGSSMQRVNSFLAELTIQTPGFIQDMWRAIDSVRQTPCLAITADC